MSYPEAVLRGALASSSSVNSVLAGRIYPVRHVGPQPVTFPLVIWRRARIRREQAMSGPVGMPRVTVEYSIYGTTYESVRDLADRVRRVLDGYSTNQNNLNIRQVSLEDEADDLVETEGSETSLYVVRQSYDIWWQEN